LATGSLLRGSVYSLYFEAAEHNLEKYLRSSETAIPRDALGVHAFLRRFRGLIDALDFLHNKLVSADTSENLRFAHLDLKPTNILVFMQSNERPHEIWKIHDFGVSRVSKRRHRGEVRGWKCLLPMAAASSSSSGTTTIRSGSFLAPETHVGRDSDIGKVKSASDVWSLGCILSLVISFLDDGPRSIEKFERDRKTGPDIISDHFFVRNKRNNHVLNPGVKCWFEKLEKRFADSDKQILLAIRNIIYLLKNRILLIKPETRASSKRMEELFDNILSRLNAPPSINRSESIAIKRPFDKFRLLGSKEDKAREEEPKQYQLSLPLGSRRSKFSNCGEYLAYFSPEAIAFYETMRIRDTPHTKTAKMCGSARAARIAQAPTGSEWVSFDISSVYLAAFTDRDYFDVSCFYLSIHI
jgi:serine/threonine protein kinase